MDYETNPALTWHHQAVVQLSDFFKQTPEALAFVLVGSLVSEHDRADVWSDVDAKVVLADAAVEQYFGSTDWLSAFGQVIGLERHDHALMKTLRVCLEGFIRFDLTFIAESALGSPALWQVNPFAPSYAVLWSKLAGLEAQIASLPLPQAYQDMGEREIERMIDSFWLHASLAIVKVARNDLLIGLHLALGLAQDCLVLQMIRRDQAMQTTIHRTGGWGHEILSRLAWAGGEPSREAVLNLIQACGEVFDSLAHEIQPAYRPRSSLLSASLEAARQAG